MERLTITGRPKTCDKIKCLPGGDALPIWSALSLDSKIPMMDNPKGSVVLYTTKLGRPKHRNTQQFDFDLSDPNGQFIHSEYEPLHDPHLKNYYSSRMMKKHLIRRGFISNDGNVVCSLKEFNHYRKYLRHLCFLETSHERKLQLESQHKKTAHSKSDSEVGGRESRGKIFRNRIRQRKERQLEILKRRINEKSARLNKRLEEIRRHMFERLERQREWMINKMAEIAKHQEEIAARGPELLRRMQFKDELRLRLMNERKRQRRLRSIKELEEKWKLRKQMQQSKLEKEEEYLKMVEQEKQKNIEKRTRMAVLLNTRLENERESLKVMQREDKERREEEYRKHLEEKLTSERVRIRLRRKASRRPHVPKFQSTWRLEDVLNQLTADSLAPADRQPSFSVMLSAAIDDAVLLPGPVEDVPRVAVEETKAADLKASQEALGSKHADISRSVRFITEEEEIPVSPNDEGVDFELFRPTSEHVVTPVASYLQAVESGTALISSPLEIQQMEAEAILGSPAFTDKTSSMSFVETLLLRLLDDLNSGRLSNEEIMKLAAFSMEVFQSKDAEAQKDRVIMEGEEEEESYVVASSSSVVARQMVDFTLGKIFDEIKSGRVPSADMAALTKAALGVHDSEEESGSSEEENFKFSDGSRKESASTERAGGEVSPVCDTLLDDFIVSTLKSLINDLDNEALTIKQIETLAKTVKDESEDILLTDSRTEIQDVQGIRTALQNILQQLQSGVVELHVLYQVVFAVVYSYNMLKSPPTREFESKITALMKDLLLIVEQRAISNNLEDVDIPLLQKASAQLSMEELDIYQIEKLSSTILEVVVKRDIICRTSTSEIARSIVEDALLKAKAKLLEEEDKTLIPGVQNIASAILSTHDKEEHISSSINDIFIDVLSFLRDSVRAVSGQSLEDFRELEEIINVIDRKEVSSSQLEEMAKSVALVTFSPLKSESSMMAEIKVKDIITNVRDDLYEGSVEMNVLDQMINNVLTTHRAIKAHDKNAPTTLSFLASFFKTVLNHMTYKVQCGEFAADDIAELTNTFKAHFEKKAPQTKHEETKTETKALQPDDLLLHPTKVTDDIEIGLQACKTDHEATQTETKELQPDELLHHLTRVIDDIEKCLLNSKDANKFGERLLKCGNKILTVLSGVSSALSTPKTEDIADGFVEEVIKALEEEIDRGLITKKSLKEITKTIITTASETDIKLADEAVGYTIRGIHRDIERGIKLPEMRSVTSLDHSPSASTIADHFVLQTIEHINTTIKQEVPSTLIVSVATSLVSLISGERIENLPMAFQNVKTTVQAIIQCLRSDTISQGDAEKIFCLILENYREFVLLDKRQESLPDSLPREDHELMNSLIDETMLHIQRCVDAGKMTKKHFSIPSQRSVAGSTTVYGDDLVELTLENLKRYVLAKSIPRSSTIFAQDLDDQKMKVLLEEQKLKSDARDDQVLQSEGGTSTRFANEMVDKTLDEILGLRLKSDAGSSTIYAHELVNLKLDDIAAGVETDAGSTTIYAFDLVNITLQNLSSSQDVAGTPKPKDIVDFILQIIDILADELAKGAISDLSMAHFFSVISGDSSDLHILEANAMNNLRQVRQDISERRGSSAYVHRILDAYIVPSQTVIEMFSDPAKAVESIMISVSSEILTKFVKATLQTILVEIREGNLSLSEKAPSTFVLRSASSIVAENVIQEVVTRIKHDIAASVQKPIKGAIGKKEFDRAASSLLASPQLAGRLSKAEQKDSSDSKHSITSNMSREVEDVVLETVHNIVSNLRLEQSMYPRTTDEKAESHSSDEIQEFVLDALQTIVTDIQDKKALYELGMSREQSKRTDTVVGLHDIGSAQTIQYVNEVLQNVIHDMRNEKSIELTEEEISKKSAVSLDTMILDCLQNAVTNAAEPSTSYGLEPEQEDEVKRIVVESIKQTIKRIKENKIDKQGITSLSQGLASIIKTDNEQTAVSPECLIEFLEKEIERIEDDGLDSETLGRISTQLATLGMEMMVSSDEVKDKKIHSESAISVSVSSSLVNNLIQDVLAKISTQLEGGEEKFSEGKAHVIPSVQSARKSSSKSVSQKDVNYNRKTSSTSRNTGPSSANTSQQKDLNRNRQISASSGVTQATGVTNISEFTQGSGLSLPDNSQTAVAKQTIRYKLSQEITGKASQSVTTLAFGERKEVKKTASASDAIGVQKEKPLSQRPISPKMRPKSTSRKKSPKSPILRNTEMPSTETSKRFLADIATESPMFKMTEKKETPSAGAAAKSTKKFRHVEYLQKPITKANTALHKLPQGKNEPNSHSNMQNASQKNLTPKREKSSSIIRSTSAESKKTSAVSKTVKVNRKPALKLETRNESENPNKQLRGYNDERKKTEILHKPQSHMKLENRQLIRKSADRKKNSQNEYTDDLYARRSLPLLVQKNSKTNVVSNGTKPGKTTLRPKQTKKEVTARNAGENKSISKTPSRLKQTVVTHSQPIVRDATKEIKSVCGSHRSKLTLRDTEQSISSSENDLSYTSRIF